MVCSSYQYWYHPTLPGDSYHISISMSYFVLLGPQNTRQTMARSEYKLTPPAFLHHIFPLFGILSIVGPDIPIFSLSVPT